MASSFSKIVRLSAAFAFIAGGLPAPPPQGKSEKPKAGPQDFPKRCNPVIVKDGKPDGRTITVHKGEKSTGYTPLITFQIAPSGDVINIHLKRSSGFRDVDEYALSSFKSSRYTGLLGCPVIDVEASVNVDF